MRKLFFLLLIGCLSDAVQSQETLTGAAVFTTTSVKDTVRFQLNVEEDSTLVRHIWLFGDGRISEASAPVHVYDECGVYKVKHLRMLLDKGGAVTRTDSFFANVSTACPMVCELKPSFKWQQIKYDPLTDQVLGNNTVFFTNTTPGGMPKGAKFRWYVDGQSHSPLWDPRIDFPYGGHFTVCLQITLPNGCEAKYCARINVADL